MLDGQSPAPFGDIATGWEYAEVHDAETDWATTLLRVFSARRERSGRDGRDCWKRSMSLLEPTPDRRNP